MGSKPNGKPPNRSPFLSLSTLSTRSRPSHAIQRDTYCIDTHRCCRYSSGLGVGSDGWCCSGVGRPGGTTAGMLLGSAGPSLPARLGLSSLDGTGRDQTANSIGIDSRCAWVVARVRTYDGAPMEPALALAAPVGGLAWQALKPNKEKRTKLKARSASMCFCKSEHFTRAVITK
jgi:hypothetical protein